MVVAVTAAILFAATAFVAQMQLSNGDDSGQTAHYDLLARAHSARVSAYINHYSAMADKLASEPSLAQLLVEGKPQALSARAEQLGYAFPDALLVRLLPPGVDTVDTTTTPNLSYACLDLLHSADKGEKPAIEIHLFNSTQEHIDIVRPIKSGDGTIVGALQIALSVKGLQATIGKIANPGGYVELQQGVGGDRMKLAAKGAVALKGTTSVHTSKIAGTGWSVRFWPQPPASGGSDPLLIWVVAGASIAILLVVLVMVLRQISGALRSDMALVINMVKAMREGRVVEPQRAALVGCRDTLALLVQMGRGGRGAAAQSVDEAAQENGADGGESTLEDEIFGDDKLKDDLGPSLIFQGDDTSMIVDEDENVNPIFRAYDIRGVVGETLTAEIVEDIGRAIGSEAFELGEQAVIVARDGRNSSPELADALIKGICESGRDVIDIGMVPTPLLYFATNLLGSTSGVMVTGSHNPANYNGLKIVLRGETIAGDAIQKLRRRIEDEDFLSGDGEVNSVELENEYSERVLKDVRLQRGLKVVIDCGNGVAGKIAPILLRQLGCDVVELYCSVDGNFPNHHPNPSDPENLKALITAVAGQGADIGLAFDGDGDRLGVVDSNGKIIWPDRLMMLFARDVISRHAGAEIIFDIKCSSHLERVIREAGGKATMWNTGHSLIKAKMKESGSLLAGEMSGHIFFKERWFGFDDALYAAARLLEILSASADSSGTLFDALPDSVNTPELQVEMAEGELFRFMKALQASGNFEGAKLTTIDGIRADYEEGWGLVRASNTTPCLVLRFEANSEAALSKIQKHFHVEMLKINRNIKLPF
ncbi:hypothetical protein BOW53_09870 [Solemya pervernicosa gill symbiont]|uniref:phosphomannomutase n=2 Tax=Gammaproteobacteria incertae sedis TaxID=118884 RepID=A0A1T2L479_9GAMM|nr:hypothetical protein BOW53_09870 [Solemya pervernicosa gill symbiont]